MTPGRVITVESTDAVHDTGLITLDCETVGRWVSLVVPSREPADTAARFSAGAGR
ncbi:hypothetical protein [Streptomyces sp. MAI_2237]